MYVVVPEQEEIPNVRPEEIPNRKEKAKEENDRKKIEIKGTEDDIMNILSENEEKIFTPKVLVKELEKYPIVSLQWERNFKNTINWMRKHMETYEETHEGFLVEFIDEKQNNWYEVVPCSEGENGDEKIGWKSYKLLPFTLENENEKVSSEEVGDIFRKIKNITEKEVREIINNKKTVKEIGEIILKNSEITNEDLIKILEYKIECNKISKEREKNSNNK